MLDFFESFARMEPKCQVATVIGLLFGMSTPVAIAYTIKGGVRRFRAGRRWLALVWALGCVVIWVVVTLAVILVFTVIQKMP